MADVNLLTASDQRIWDEAIARLAILVTKDRDFALLRAARRSGPTILWIRSGNIGNRTLIDQILRVLPTIAEAADRGEGVIEFVGC